MKKILNIRFSLAWIGLMLFGFAYSGSAQLINYDYTFDSDNGSSFQGWVQWWNNGISVDNILWNGTLDASNNPASGCLEIDSTFTGSAGQYYPIWVGWGGNTNAPFSTATSQWNTSVRVNMDNYQSVSFDLMMDPSSATLSTNGTFGSITIFVNINWGQPVIKNFTIPASATNGWIHFSATIPKGMGNAWGPAFFRYGAADSAGSEKLYIDNLNFQPIPAQVTFTTQPLDEEVWPTNDISLTAAASGATPIYYQWYKGTIALTNGANIFGATNSVLKINNVSAADVATYYVVATNFASVATSSVVNVSVLAGPDNLFASEVQLDGPLAFYQLNETSDTSLGHATAFDRISGLSGLYQNTVSNSFNGVAGPRSSDGFTNLLADNGAAQFPGNDGKISLPPLNLNSASATFCAWIKPEGTSQPGAAGIVFCRSSSTGGSGLAYNFDGQNLGYNWNNDTPTWQWASGVVPPTNQWSFVVLVVTPSDATIYCFNTNTGYATPLMGHFIHAHGPSAFDNVTTIGQDTSDPARTFNGAIDDVAVFQKALTQGQITELYIEATGDQVSPSFDKNPASITRFTGAPMAQFTGEAYGSRTIGYYWQKVGGSLAANVSGTNSTTLAITNLVLANAGDYQLVATNSKGSATSSPATLTLVSPAGAYATEIVAQKPVAFYELNETDQTQPATDSWGGHDGTYGVNVYGGWYGNPGPLPADGFTGFTSTNYAATIQQVSGTIADNVITLPGLGMNTASATFTAWINPAVELQNAAAGLIFYRNGGGSATGIQYNGTVTNSDASVSSSLGYSWADLSGSYSWNSNIRTPAGVWSFVALTVTPTNATISVYTSNTVQRAVNTLSHPAMNFTGPTIIGDDNYSVNRTWQGTIDSVAIFGTALSTAELDNLATIGGLHPPGVLQLQGMQLHWNSGTLQQAPSLSGPWTPVSGATSPYTITPTAPMMFYRTSQ